MLCYLVEYGMQLMLVLFGQIRNAIGTINEMDAGAIQSNTDCNLMLVLFGLILDAGAIWSDTECNGCNGRSTAGTLKYNREWL